MKFCRLKKNHRAFTIVELVIVIAVIAILAAVLIPTFSNVIKKANESKALQEERNAKNQRALYEVDAKAGQNISLATASLVYDNSVAKDFVTSSENKFALTEESVAVDGYSFVYTFTKASSVTDADLFYEIYIKYYDESKTTPEDSAENALFKTSSADFLNIENAKEQGCTVSSYAKPEANTTYTQAGYISIKTEQSGDNYTITIKSLSDDHPIVSVSLGYKTAHLTSTPVLHYTQDSAN